MNRQIRRLLPRGPADHVQRLKYHRVADLNGHGTADTIDLEIFTRFWLDGTSP